jgi:hypothetical protein
MGKLYSYADNFRADKIKAVAAISGYKLEVRTFTWLHLKYTSGVGTCPLNLVGSAGQCSRPLSTAVGSAGQGRAVFGQSDLAKNWAVFGQFFG